MTEMKVIERIKKPTEYVSSLAYSRKSSGKIRICLYPKHLNEAIRRPHYPTPTLEEMTFRLEGATVFSKLDARSGYWSITLDDESSTLTTFNTPFGRYRFLRLPFGLNLSQDIFQERMDIILENCPGTISIADDIGVFGKDQQEHYSNLMNLMKEALKNGLVFNDTKCSIGTSSLPFFGLTFDKKGVHPNENRIKAIKAFNIPNNDTELIEFLGIATYMSTFIPNLVTLTAELRDILKEEEHTWKESNTEDFKKVKEAIFNATTLAYFRPGIPTTIQVDASGRGLGAVLLQENIPIAFASKSLTTTEQRYANIEREMLAIVFGCERFHYYIYGREFAVITDHKPLEMITKKSLEKAPARLQRMMLRIQTYNYTVTYSPGNTMTLADTLSRQPDADNAAHIDLDVAITPIQFSTETQRNTRRDKQ